MKRTLLTVVVNVHKEGVWAHRALRSVIVALEKLLSKRPGERVQIIVVQDRGDQATFEVCARVLDSIMNENIQADLYLSDFGDLGLARNKGVMFAGGRFVAFLDGDDVWGEDWAWRGVDALEQTIKAMGGAEVAERFVAAHPCTNVDFGDGAFWWTQPDQRDEDFDPATFWTTNCWSSGVMATRETLLFSPYVPRTEGLGFEDWEWNARTLAAGVLHVSVPQTVVFIRKKNDGMNVESARKRQLPTHSPYHETDPEMLPRHKNVPRLVQEDDPDWLKRNWRNVHTIEPLLWPDARRVQSLPRYRAHASYTVPALVKLIRRKVDYVPTHVILAPCIVRGGADKRIVNYAEAAARAGGKPLVLLLDRKGDDSFSGSVDERVHVIDAAQLLEKAGGDAATLALARLIMQWRPVVHVVNSRTGFNLMHLYGTALRDSSAGPFYVSLYGADKQKGRFRGAGLNGWFEAAHKTIDVVISDNVNHLAELRRVFGWNGTTGRVPSIVNVPSEDKQQKLTETRSLGHKAMRVLWASRIVKGKRLDRLLEVARAAYEHQIPVLFSVAGEVGDTASQAVVTDLKKLPNVKLSTKAFSSWEQLAPEKHDAFMFTSETEGMPNVVLEALAHGLCVASSDVGDVGTIPGVRLVDDPDKAEAWLDALVRVVGLGKNSVAWVRDNHSVEAFDIALGEVGYFDRIKER